MQMSILTKLLNRWNSMGGHAAQHAGLGVKRQYMPPRPPIWPGVGSDVPTLATSGPGGPSPVTGTYYPYNTSIVRLAGCVPALYTALGTNYNANNSAGVTGSGATISAVEFEGYFDDIALIFRNAVASSSKFWVWTADPTTGLWKPTTAAPVTSSAATANNQFWERITFGAAAQRQVRVYYWYADFGGVVVKPTQTLVPTASPGRSLCVITDSYGGGAVDVDQFHTWPVSLARLLCVDLYLNAVGGTGYVSQNGALGGNNNYASAPRIAAAIAAGATDYLLAGSINDSGQTTATVTAAAQSLITQIKAGVPNARIWMTGVQGLPVAASTTGTNAANNTALAALAASNGIPFIDTMTGWYSGTGKVGATAGDGNRDVFLNTDGVHPSLAGSDYIAARKYQSLISLGW